MTDFASSIACSRPSTPRTGLMGYIDLYRQRRALAALDDTRLADLGLTRHEAQVEANRPVWDAPVHWK
ncbi:MAG: DUF1127 domain-containing protein [Litoreibacter sp.]|uniref:DUF1127 domain-containing protein n=1 Tax=Litoreibacter sp. TaxID=1969459 RepID=UPI003296F926